MQISRVSSNILDNWQTSWEKTSEKRRVDGWECPFFRCPDENASTIRNFCMVKKTLNKKARKMSRSVMVSMLDYAAQVRFSSD